MQVGCRGVANCCHEALNPNIVEMLQTAVTKHWLLTDSVAYYPYLDGPPTVRALTSFYLYFVDVSYALLPVMVLSYHSSPLLLTMQCWPLARGSFISERPQKQLSDYSVHKWWSSVITTLSALASPLGFLVFTVSLPLCGGNVNYLKLRCDEVALLRRTCVIAYDKWHSFALKCHEGGEQCLLSGKYVALNVSTCACSASHCQYCKI